MIENQRLEYLCFSEDIFGIENNTLTMGFMQWLKKEIDSSHFSRRQSAPSKSLKSFDPNKSRDEAYILAMNKFMEYRQNEKRKRRVTEGITTTRFSYYSDKKGQQKNQREIIDVGAHASGESNRIDNKNGPSLTQTAELHTLPGHRSTSSSNPSTVEKIDSNFGRQNSLPANMSKNYIVKSHRKKKGKAPQPSTKMEPNIIHENEIQAFERNHCQMDSPEINDTSNMISPPAGFYKADSNPFRTSVESGNFGAYNRVPICPAKPKRHLLGQKNTKELIEARFNGAYKDYEFHNRWYDGKDREIVTEEEKRFSPDGETSNSGRYSPQYQIIRNKHGQMVEYAVPFCEQESLDHHHSKQQSINLEDEVFEEDPNACEKIVRGTYRLIRNEHHPLRETVNSRNSLYTKRARKQNEHILVTDLDKSIDSWNMMDGKRQSQYILDELKSLSTWSENLTKTVDPKSKSQNELLELIYSVKPSMIHCCNKEITRKTSVLQNTFPSPIDIASGVFRQTTVTLRNHLYPNIQQVREESLLIAGEAIKRDYDILKQIRHRGIIMLMAVCVDLDYKNLTLILEPADCTLHYFLHQMNERSTLLDLISIVQQIASAVAYLHRCGYIHSNISSHCILMSRSPHSAKLSSFELATSVSSGIQQEIESKYRRHSNRADECLTNIPTYALLMRNNDKLLKTHYRDMSKNMARDLNNSKDYSIQCLSDVEPKYLPYYVDYRRQLSVFNYQAPELLATTEGFVYPTRRSDVYSLSLLLWELLNYSVPFAIFNESELKHLYRENRAELKIFEERRCKYFKQILKYGTATDPDTRSMTVELFISVLEDIKFEFDSDKSKQTHSSNQIHHTQSIDDIGLGQTTRHDLEETNLDSENERNENIYENTEDIMNDIDAQVISPEIMKEVQRGFKKKPVAPPVSPSPKNDKVLSPLNNITDSTLYRSIGDFKKVLSPIRACNRLIERNSTLKKRKKPQSNTTSPKQALNFTMYDNFLDLSTKLNQNIENWQDDANQHMQAADTDIIGPLHVPELQLPSRNIIKRQQTKYMDRMLNDDNTGVDENDSRSSNKSSGRSNPMIVSVTPKRQKMTTDSNENRVLEEAHNSSMGIALKNQIRRNAWLSKDAPIETTRSIPTPRKVVPIIPERSSASSSVEDLKNALIKPVDQKANKGSSSSNESSGSSDAIIPASKNLNVSIKIVHQNVTPERNDLSNKNQCVDISGNAVITDESPSVSARIKFWNSLKAPIITPRQNRKPQQKHVEYSTAQTCNLPEVIEINSNSPLEKEISDEFNEFSHKINQAQQWFESLHGGQKHDHSKSLSKSIEYSKPHKIQSPNDLNNSLQISKFSDNFMDNSRYEAEIRRKENELLTHKNDVSLITAQLLLSKVNDHSVLKNMIVSPKHKSMSESVKCMERTGHPNKSLGAVKIIGNKFFNEKINNTDLLTTDSVVNPIHSESIDDIMEIEGKVIGEMDVQNEANALVQPPTMDIVLLKEPNPEEKDPIKPVADSQTNKGNKTMIKRTYYQESIITGTDVEVPELEKMLETQSTSASHVSSANKLTTHVTLNLRNFQRRSSDFGLKGREENIKQSPRMTETRHSISGNDFPSAGPSHGEVTAVATTSGRSLQEFLSGPGKPKTSCTCVPSALVSQQSINCTSTDTDTMKTTVDILSSFRRINVSKNIQSIEDLYIDDDFCSGMCLAANMKLVTNSNDTLGMNNINFDSLSSQINEAFGESGDNSRPHTTNQMNTKNH